MIWLYNSRIIAIFAVTLLHTASLVLTRSETGSEYWWIADFYDSSARWCVPVFVMISGALLLHPDKKENLQTFYKKRFSRILLPLLFWSAFFLLWAILTGLIKGNPPSLKYLIKALLSGRPHYHMWFLYMIVTLYLFTPFFRKVSANSTRTEMVVLTISGFLLAGLNALCEKMGFGSGKLFLNWFLSYIPFFFLGHLIQINDLKLSKTILWGVFLLSLLMTTFGCYFLTRARGLEAGLYFYEYLSITVIPMSMSMICLLKYWTKPIINNDFTKTLSFLTLGAYLIHPVILESIQYSGFGPLSFYPALSIPLISTVVFCTSLSAAWLIYHIPYLKRVI